MKVVIILLLFFISVTTAVSSVDGANKINVIDTDGQALTRNGEYHIVPIGGGGGGLSGKSLSYCVFAVIQEEEENRVEPLTFHPPDDEDVIRLSTDHKIAFGGVSVCSPLTWRVEKGDHRNWFILGGEGIGHDPIPARNQTDTVDNVFKIETHQDGYKFSYCPTLCNACNVTSCSDVGIIMEGDGLRRLALTQLPLGVKFKRVN